MRDGVLRKGDWAYANMEPFAYYLQHGGHNATHIYDADTPPTRTARPGPTSRAGADAAHVPLRPRAVQVPGAERASIRYMAPFALAREIRPQWWASTWW